MSSDSGNSSAGTVLLALLGGAVAGAAIALLYAPQSGRRTRQKLSDLGQDAEDFASEQIERAKETLGRAQEFVADKKRQLAGALDGSKASS